MNDNSSHDMATRKGEEMGTGNEAGREHSADHPEDHVPGRTARDATSINPEKRGPIDPSMPHMPPA